MRLDLDNLPHDTGLLHRLVRDMAALMSTRDEEIERLRHIVKELQRMRFGRRSERLDPDQLALGLEDLDTDIAALEADRPTDAAPPPEAQPRRKPLPDHLPREEVVLDVPGKTCPDCGRPRHAIGESVSEMLDWVPASLRVIRVRRPKYGCRACGTLQQAPAPERVIVGGFATPGLGLTPRYFAMLLRLSFLAPDIVAAILDGHQPIGLNRQRLARIGNIPLGWREQRAVLGFSQA